MYRSGFEGRVAAWLEKADIPFNYEARKVNYTLVSSYTPDLFLNNGVVLELKGFWKPSDRRKIKAVCEQHPEMDLRMVFMRNNTLTSKSKTTYLDWCEKHNIPACVFPHIPDDWLK